MKGRFHLDAGALSASARRALVICLFGAMLGMLFNAASPRGIDLLGPVPPRGAEGITELDLEEAWALHKARKGVFIDARSAEEFGQGHIPGALLLPLDDFDEVLSSFATLIPSDTLLIAYCGKGCESSWEVAELLKEEGYSNLKVFYGGWDKWKSAGYPVEKDEMKTESAFRSNQGIGLTEGG